MHGSAGGAGDRRRWEAGCVVSSERRDLLAAEILLGAAPAHALTAGVRTPNARSCCRGVLTVFWVCPGRMPPHGTPLRASWSTVGGMG